MGCLGLVQFGYVIGLMCKWTFILDF
ncbi:hypothetical protein F383_12821 [Gossypium arboreum]|uniref:Uncharacterized protein n=1 Tax=Gossypium arboreum TaxID=29729 RepID=A0A0B0N838_GOSAR|nr:hypothetical protein F383_36066 [Gossypium arboreum]KHG10304.1 hypothetical protein F383_12821 [Gossypium arboreum]